MTKKVQQRGRVLVEELERFLYTVDFLSEKKYRNIFVRLIALKRTVFCSAQSEHCQRSYGPVKFHYRIQEITRVQAY